MRFLFTLAVSLLACQFLAAQIPANFSSPGAPPANPTFIPVEHSTAWVSNEPPPPLLEDGCRRWFFDLDLMLLSSRVNGMGSFDEDNRTDVSLSPRFTFGLKDDCNWSPYVSYQFLNSWRKDRFIDEFGELLAERKFRLNLHKIDFALRSPKTTVLSIIQLQWDVGARLALFSGRDWYDLSPDLFGFFHYRLRERYIGAGPMVGLNSEIPIARGLSLSGRAETSITWGNWQACLDTLGPADGIVRYEANKGGIFWNYALEAGMIYAPTRWSGNVRMGLGYRYEAWYSKDLNILTGEDGTGRFDFHGPYFRLEIAF